MAIPRPEYPRPRLVRKDWLNLNGEWQFEIDSTNTGIERDYHLRDDFSDRITVPFAPESKLSGVEHKDYMKAVWYRRTFTLPALWEGGRVLLNFGAVDYRCRVWVNGVDVGGHIGGYTPFSLDITKALSPEKADQTVVVYAYDDVLDLMQPSGKQSDRYDNYSCVYTRSTGIWQTVWLEHVPDVYVTNLRLDPDVDQGELKVRVNLNDRLDGEVKFEASYHGKPVGEKVVRVGGKSVSLSLALSELHLWFPGAPELYDLRINAGEDSFTTYFGMRKVAIRGRTIEINDRPVFQRLVLDQGYYPSGIYTAPTVEDMKHDIEMSMAVGFNGARMHMKVFEPTFSYLADHLGYLLWAEYPNWGLDTTDPASLVPMLDEWLEAMDRDYNSPAIITWCPFNETSLDRVPRLFETIYDVIHEIDPMRPVVDSSGWTHAGKTDIYDVHDYEQDVEVFRGHYESLMSGEGLVFKNHRGDGGERNLRGYNRNHYYVVKGINADYGGQPYGVTEFGGMRWDIDNDGSAGWGYGNAPKDIDEFYARLEGMVQTLLDNPKISVFCYTQLYDVMQEKNGIYSFDRRPKFDAARLRAILTREAAIEKQS